MKRLQAIPGWWDSFFYAASPLPLCAMFRIGYASMLLLNVSFWLPDLHRWFGADGLFPKGTTEAYYGHPMFSLLHGLPETNTVAYACYAVFLVQIFCLLIGCWTRVQAACVFLWLLSFKNHSPMLWAGEDAVFSIFGFMLAFLASGEVLSVDAARRARRGLSPAAAEHPIWPLRIIQLQTCLILLAGGLQKLSGESWRDGTALYYISRLDDSFGRFPMPSFLLEWLPAIKVMTWSVIAVEILVPVFIWHPKFRRIALGAALMLHLGIEYAMDLFLFEWIMILGWCTFLRFERPPGFLGREKSAVKPRPASE